MATSRRGKHRATRQRRLPLPVAAGSATVAVALVGSLTMSTAGAAVGTDVSSLAMQAPSRPTAGPAAVADDTDPFAGITSATAALTQATEQASTETHEKLAAEEKRKQAEERAAREAAERERLASMYTKPVANYTISSHFGGYRGHGGLDLAGPSGQPITAVHSGTVVFTGWDGSYGNKVVVRHSDGTETWYGHLSSISVGLGPVITGAQLGTLGSTGNSTGPHLHLEVRTADGGRINPYSWLQDKGITL